MFETDAIHKRGNALEDEFFHRVDEKLREDLRKKMQREESRKVLAEATGFQDLELVDHLLDAGFEPASVAALALVPAIQVAWADGSVTFEERQTIMSAALESDLSSRSSAFLMIEQWLREKPSASLWTLWKEYIAAVKATVPADMAGRLSAEIVRQATAVAKASGGAFGFGKVSSAEQAILNEVESTLRS